MKHEAHHLPVEHESPDVWHQHSKAEGTPQPEHAAVASPGALLIAFLAISTTVALTVLILVVFFDQYATRYKAEVIETTALSKSFNEYKSRWEEQDIRGYAVADAQTGAVRIPLDKAMQRVLERYSKAPATPAK